MSGALCNVWYMYTHNLCTDSVSGLPNGCFKVFLYMHLQDDIHVQMNAQQHNIILNPFNCLHRKLCVYLRNSHWTVLHYGTISCHSYLIWKPLLLHLLNFWLSIATFLLTQWEKHLSNYSLQALSPSVSMYLSSVVGSHNTRSGYWARALENLRHRLWEGHSSLYPVSSLYHGGVGHSLAWSKTDPAFLPSVVRQVASVCM